MQFNKCIRSALTVWSEIVGAGSPRARGYFYEWAFFCMWEQWVHVLIIPKHHNAIHIIYLILIKHKCYWHCFIYFFGTEWIADTHNCIFQFQFIALVDGQISMNVYHQNVQLFYNNMSHESRDKESNGLTEMVPYCLCIACAWVHIVDDSTYLFLSIGRYEAEIL